MITTERLRELFEYLPNGRLSRRVVLKGEKRVTEGRAKNGYLIRWVDKHCYYEHALVYLYCHGEWVTEIDHINHVRDDNRIENLRPCDRTLNNANRGPVKSLTGLRGVTLRDSGRYHARIYVRGKRILLGLHDSAEDAGRAYDIEARKHFGKFARLNFPEKP